MKTNKTKRKPGPRTIPLPAPLDTPTLRRLSVLAQVDPRTLRAVAAGRQVRGMAGERAREALRTMGYPLLENVQVKA